MGEHVTWYLADSIYTFETVCSLFVFGVWIYH